jgi:hypothetical protein
MKKWKETKRGYELFELFEETDEANGTGNSGENLRLGGIPAEVNRRTMKAVDEYLEFMSLSPLERMQKEWEKVQEKKKGGK